MHSDLFYKGSSAMDMLDGREYPDGHVLLLQAGIELVKNKSENARSKVGMAELQCLILLCAQ